jgi:hypothetical protein
LANALRQRVENMYPHDFQAVHRAVLTVSAREFGLNGYLHVQRPSDVLLIAEGDLGGTAFEIAGRAQTATIIANAAGLRRSWLEEGALRDAFVIYCHVPSQQAGLELVDAKTLGLVDVRADGMREEFLFDAATHRYLGYNRRRRGKCLYHIQFFDEGVLPHYPNPIPRFITIADHQLQYELAISVLDVRPNNLQKTDGEEHAQ